MTGQAELAADALALAAALLAVDPQGLGGARLSGPSGPVRDAWLQAFSALLPAGTPWRRLPLHASEDRLVGGLDLQATLSLGKPVLQQGLLAASDGGVLVAPMVERLAAGTAAQLAAVLDRGAVHIERDGLSAQAPARLALLALDEAEADDAPMSAALADRLALWLPLRALGWRDAPPTSTNESAEAVAAARSRLATVALSDDLTHALVTTAAALGVESPRAAWFAVRVARASAALFGRQVVTVDDADLAARLVLAPRATRVPAETQDETESEAAAATPPPHDSSQTHEPAPATPEDAQTLDDRVLEAAKAAIPAGLLAQLMQGDGPRTRQARAGKAGVATASRHRGRPQGARRGPPQQGARLHLIATLRAAAPWQPLRRRSWSTSTAARTSDRPQPRVHVRPDDFHVRRYAEKRGTTTVFAVDASGSSALHRLAEAKGAVELLLAECYVRRDEVAVVAFRGPGAELLLAPTRSLVRARRALAGLPGGGGTPLAAGIVAAMQVAVQVRREGAMPLLVLLTDGRANVTRSGIGGRAQAAEEALAAARQWRSLGLQCLLVDTSVRPEPAAAALALAMGARYLALPQADARALNQAVQAVQRGLA